MTRTSKPETPAIPLANVLPAVAERIHYAEGRRTNFTVVAGALFAGGVAVLTFITDKNLGNFITYLALTASIGSIGLGLLLLIVFARQTNRYPWTAATKTWKWFYRDALPNQAEFDPTWRDIFQPNKEKERLQNAFNDQLPKFESTIQNLTDNKTSLEQDVQQLYVLHINEKFKNTHLSQLRTILSKGVTFIALASAAFGAWGYCSDYKRTAFHLLYAQNGDSKVSAQWRFVSKSSDSGLILARVTVVNKKTISIPLPSWTMVDTRGVPVPAVISSATASPKQIPPNTTVTYSIFIKPAEHVDVKDLAARF
jgi:hypothetical protein